MLDLRRKDNDKEVKVAIIDSGLDTSHPDFPLYNFEAHNYRDLTGTSATHDAVGDGIHAAELVHGVAPRAELYIAKAFNLLRLCVGHFSRFSNLFYAHAGPANQKGKVEVHREMMQVPGSERSVHVRPRLIVADGG